MTLLLALLACKPTETDAPVCDVAAAPQKTAVITQIRYARATDGVSEGFDLDGATTVPGDGTGCNVQDWVSPDGDPGIDNAWARLVPALDQTEAAAVEGLIQAQINSGNLLMLWQLDGLADPSDDTCVDFSLMRGGGVVSLGTNGLLEPSQTFRVDPSVPTAQAWGSASGGTATVGPLTIDLPITIFDVSLVFEMQNARFAIVDNGDGTYHGYFGGGVDVATLIAVASSQNVNPSLVGILRTLLDTNSDLDPQADGTCGQISITFEFDAEDAFLYPS